MGERQDTLRSMLRFLAMRPDEQLLYLPPFWPRVDYLLDDTGDRTDNPLYYFAYRVWQFLEHHESEEDEFYRALREIWTVLTVMLDGAYGYVWIRGGPLEKPVSGPADGLWDVLRRLARHALSLKGWEATKPDLPFDRAVRVVSLGPSTRGKETTNHWRRRPCVS